MRCLLFLVLLLSPTLCFAEALSENGEAGATVLHLSERACVALAAERNPQSALAWERIVAAEARVDQARSARRPQLSAGLTFNYISGLESDIGNSPLERLVNVDKLSPEKHIGLARVGFEQVLYAGGSLRASILAAEALVQSEQHQRAVSLALLELETRIAFYDVLLADALLEVAHESVLTFQRHLEDGQRMLDAGYISGFELLRAETELSAREAGVVSAQTVHDLAVMNLKRLLGLAHDEAVALQGDLESGELVGDLAALVARARHYRPEILALQAAIDAAEHEVAARKGAYRPRAGASVDLQHIEGGTAYNPDGLVVGFNAEWDIYAGGKRKAEVQEASSRLRSLELQLTEAQGLVEMDVRQAYRRAEEAAAKIRRDEATMALGDESLRLAELRFQQGVGRQADTLDAELAATQARTARVQALRDFAAARAELERAAAMNWLAEATPDQAGR